MRPSSGRTMTCSFCARKFRSPGTTRVLNAVVFHFCGLCWTLRRRRCEGFAESVAERQRTAQEVMA